MIKNKYLFSSVFIVLFLFGVNFVLAADVSLPGLGDNPDFPTYIGYLFKFGIGLAGVLALISFVIGALGLMLSGDNTGSASEAKDRMKGAILGLALTLCSWLILNTINPYLTKVDLTPIDAVNLPENKPAPGVYFFTTAGCNDKDTSKGAFSSGAITSSEPSLRSPFNGNLKSIKIINDTDNGIYYGYILHEAGLNAGGGCMSPVSNEGCQAVSINATAIDIFRLNKTAGNPSGKGVTFYSRPWGELTGTNSGFYSVSDQKISAVTSTLYKATPGDMCYDYTGVDEPDSYKYKCTNSSCGGGDYGCKNDEDCYEDETCNISAGKKSGTCVGSDGTKLCSDTACETVQDKNCQGAMTISGNYLVALYSKMPASATSGTTNGAADGTGITSTAPYYCQTFTKNVDNLKGEPFLASGIKKIESIYIIPTCGSGDCGSAPSSKTPTGGVGNGASGSF